MQLYRVTNCTRSRRIGRKKKRTQCISLQYILYTHTACARINTRLHDRHTACSLYMYIIACIRTHIVHTVDQYIVLYTQAGYNNIITATREVTLYRHNINTYMRRGLDGYRCPVINLTYACLYIPLQQMDVLPAAQLVVVRLRIPIITVRRCYNIILLKCIYTNRFLRYIYVLYRYGMAVHRGQ